MYPELAVECVVGSQREQMQVTVLPWRCWACDGAATCSSGSCLTVAISSVHINVTGQTKRSLTYEMPGQCCLEFVWF